MHWTQPADGEPVPDGGHPQPHAGQAGGGTFTQPAGTRRQRVGSNAVTEAAPGGTLSCMGTFDLHSDVGELDGMQGAEALASLGLFLRSGAWTGSHGRTGFVPDHIVQEFGGDADSIGRLVEVGLWERGDGGYRMLRGPHSDPDQPLPLWRYSDDDLGGRLFAIDDTPND